MKEKIIGMISRLIENGDLIPGKSKKDTPPPQDGYEICIHCGNETDIRISTPVDQRIGYIPGCGQMCRQCYEKAMDSNSCDRAGEQLAYLRDLCQQDDKK